MATPKQLITKQFGIDLCENYINSRSRIIADAIGEDDANAIWYSLEEMEDYIAYVKAQAASHNYTVDGVRMYLGVYPDNTAYGAKAGKTTIFLTPTQKGSTGSGSADISDIEPLDMGTMGQPPIIEYPSL